MKFESLHNFDLGVTAEILRIIGEYFAVLFDTRVATKMVDMANINQKLLIRRPQTGLFRLPQAGTMIAPLTPTSPPTSYLPLFASYRS